MNEKRYLEIRKEVFEKIYKNNAEKQQLEAEAIMVQGKLDRKMKTFNKIKDIKETQMLRGLILETYNLSILKKKNLIREKEMYSLRLQSYMRCIISLSKHDHIEYSSNKKEFVEELKRQAIEKIDLDVSIIRQKRLTYNKMNAYLDAVKGKTGANFFENKDGLITREEIDSDNMKQFDLEEEKRYMINAFENEEYELGDDRMEDDQKLCDTSPVDAIRSIYPKFRDTMLSIEEGKKRK